MKNSNLIESFNRYIGQTVTIYTSSGGASGSGFTGVLAGFNQFSVRLIAEIGMAPAYPLNGYNGYNNNSYEQKNAAKNNCCDDDCGNNWLGSVVEIPIDKIVSFNHSSL